jgi:hypothetical protein
MKSISLQSWTDISVPDEDYEFVDSSAFVDFALCFSSKPAIKKLEAVTIFPKF